MTKTKSISIVSGKGGVGKSNLTLNLGYTLSRMEHNTLIVDCDTGLANMDVLLGIAPEKHMQDILVSGDKPEDIVMPIAHEGPAKFDLIPANSGLAAFAELDSSSISIVCSALNPFAENYDYLLLDIGAGISPTALSFAAATAMRILVVTPEPTSMTDGYAFMKVLTAKYDVSNFYILVNQVETLTEAQHTFNRLCTVCERFLRFKPTFLGAVHNDAKVLEAVRRQRPFIELFPQSQAAKDCQSLAKGLLHLENPATEEDIENGPLVSRSLRSGEETAQK